MLLSGLYTPKPVVLPTICPFKFLEGGIIDPSIYMQCCGLHLSGYMWLYLVGRGVVLVVGGVCFGGIFPCVGEFDIVVPR